MDNIRFLSCGDSAITVQLSDGMSVEVNKKIQFLSKVLNKIRGIEESVPAFCSITVYFNPFVITENKLEKVITKALASYRDDGERSGRVFVIPVCYENEFAPDMEDVCALTGLNRDEVIGIHSSRDYLIYMLGFLPGFAYLGGMDERIEVPRLDTPRTLIPAGAVGIGGKQTGIYPLASPGGWRLIGRTPVKVYDTQRSEPILYRAGDFIRFLPVTADEFNRFDGRIQIEEGRA